MNPRRTYTNFAAAALLVLVGTTAARADTLVSQPGQSLDQFVMAVKADVSKASRAAGGVEVCGGIAQVGDTYRVTLVAGKALECAFTPPEGYTGTSLHSHPKEAAQGFSQADYSAGPGYLVTRGFVYHQAGAGTARRVF